MRVGRAGFLGLFAAGAPLRRLRQAPGRAEAAEGGGGGFPAAFTPWHEVVPFVSQPQHTTGHPETAHGSCRHPRLRFVARLQ